jgi:hypothetical protein
MRPITEAPLLTLNGLAPSGLGDGWGGACKRAGECCSNGGCGRTKALDGQRVDATPTDSDILEGKSRAARRGIVGGLLRRP